MPSLRAAAATRSRWPTRMPPRAPRTRVAAPAARTRLLSGQAPGSITGGPAMKAAFRWWTIVLPFLVVVQITLVGVGAFHGSTAVDNTFGDKVVPPCDSSCGKAFKDSYENWFGPHIAFGYLLVLIGLLY